jgi:hypothetical protein
VVGQQIFSCKTLGLQLNMQKLLRDPMVWFFFETWVVLEVSV